MTIAHATTLRTTFAGAFKTAVEASGSGVIKFYTASFGNLMATVTLNTFQTAAAGATTTAAGTMSGSVIYTGVMAVFRVETGAAAEVITGTVGTAGADINLTSTSFNSGDTIVIDAVTYTASP